MTDTTRWAHLPWPTLDAAALQSDVSSVQDAARRRAAIYVAATWPQGDDDAGAWTQAYVAWFSDAVAAPDADDLASRRAALAERLMLSADLVAVHSAGQRIAADERHLAALAQLGDAEQAITVAVAQIQREGAESRVGRLAALGKVAGTIGHELRNPLGVIESSVYLLRRKMAADPAAQRHVDKIDRQARACHRIIDDLLHLARDQAPRLESLDLAEAFGQALEDAMLPDAVAVSVDAAPPLRVDADAGLLNRALVNLLRNASQAMQSEGAIELSARDGGDAVVLDIRDGGPGFDASILACAFEPLVTTRETGVGLGLALVHSITRRHGGHARALNRPEGGAHVTLSFPKAAATSHTEPE
ncbi:MAG: ATP-binding protein [Myxococcota bacterium]